MVDINLEAELNDCSCTPGHDRTGHEMPSSPVRSPFLSCHSDRGLLTIEFLETEV